MSEKIISLDEVAKTAAQVIPNTLAETDGALSTLVGWFNNVVLYPVKKANITYCYKLESFEDDLKTKISSIPGEYLHNPNITIAGPTLEALKYTFDEEELRKMYVNLLASSMDTRKDRVVHPSYVDIIRNMNSFDAVLFEFLSQHKERYIKAIYPMVRIKGTNKIFTQATPEWFIEWKPSINIFDTSASLIRLSKLGLIELMYDRDTVGASYEALDSSEILIEILQRYQSHNTNQELEITSTKCVIYVNDHGKQFAKVCL